jgi:hypothetical protein
LGTSKADLEVNAGGAYAYSAAKIPLAQKLSELLTIVRLVHLRRVFQPDEEIQRIFADFEEYQQVLQAQGGAAWETAQILEVGFGARPLRLLSLTSMGLQAQGVDIERPVLKGSAAEFLEILRTNGVERCVKSLVRFFAFDGLERWHLQRHLQRLGHRLTVQPERFRVGDAATLAIPAQSLDLIYSEDVFEHIPPDSLQALVPQMATWLKPTGLALIRPNIFTGITGGHLAEWFPQALDRPLRRRSDPWEHLRQRRFPDNTYLNQWTRSQFRELFLPHFEILEERVREPHLGREFMTDAVRTELQDYGDDELFSNLVMFVLRPR